MTDWIDDFIGGAAKNAARRQRGERPGAPMPTCAACGGSGRIYTLIEDGDGTVRTRCECTWPRPS